jgi:hypothetical protein
MRDESESRDKLPAELMHGIAWSFFGREPVEEQHALEALVAAYQIELGATDRWRPSDVAIEVPRIRVRYFGVNPDDPDEYTDYEAELSSANGQSFTNGELLFKLHNRVVGHLRDADHCYFEGMRLVEPAGEEPPLYEMIQGS